MDQGRTWVGQANQRVLDQLRNDPYSLSYNSGIRRMRDNSNNPIIKALAGIAYMNPLLSGTDMEAGAIERKQAQQEESILKSLLPSDQFQSYKDEKMHQQAYDLISKVAFNAGTINPVGGSMKGAITNALQKGTIGADEADDYMRMLQENALKGRSPVGNPEILTRTPNMTKSTETLRKTGIAEIDDLVVAPRTDSLSRSRIDEYKKLIQEGADVPGVVLQDKLVNGKAAIFDGNHRAVAYQELGMPVPISEMTVKEYQKFLTKNPQFSIDEAKKSLGETSKLYHGSKYASDIEKEGFVLNKHINNSTGGKGGQYGKGIYLTPDKSVATNYGEVVETQLAPNLKLAKAKANDLLGKSADDITREFTNAGYDGLELGEGKGKMLVIFDPKNVKVAPKINPITIDTAKGSINNFVKNKNYDVYIDEGKKLELSINGPQTNANPKAGFLVTVRKDGWLTGEHSFKTKSEAENFIKNFKYTGIDPSVYDTYQKLQLNNN